MERAAQAQVACASLSASWRAWCACAHVCVCVCVCVHACLCSSQTRCAARANRTNDSSLTCSKSSKWWPRSDRFRIFFVWIDAFYSRAHVHVCVQGHGKHTFTWKCDSERQHGEWVKAIDAQLTSFLKAQVRCMFSFELCVWCVCVCVCFVLFCFL